MFVKKSLNPNKRRGKKTRKRSSKREVQDFFACLVVVVVVDLAGRPHFFIRVVMGFAIGGAILIEKKVTVGFSEFFLR